MTQCDFGLEEGEFLTAEGMRACRDHFIQYFENKVLCTIKRFKMTKPKSKVLVAFSGGKDSTSLLYSVFSLRKRLDLKGILAVSVDEGLPHRSDGLSFAGSICNSLGIPWKEVSFKEIYGLTINQVVSVRGISKNICSYCGVLRRRAFEIVAFEEGCDVIMTGHNYDDFCQTYLMNIVRNEPSRLHRSGPATNEMEGFVPRCSPLAKIRAFETAEYVSARGIPIHKTPCPHKVGAFRLEFLNLIDELSKLLPGFEQNFTKAVERWLIYKAERPQYPLKRCAICGFPSSGEKCRPCSMRDELKTMLSG